MDSELLLKIIGYLGMYLHLGIYWVFPRLPFGIVAYAFTLILDNLCRNSCILFGPSIFMITLLKNNCICSKRYKNKLNFRASFVRVKWRHKDIGESKRSFNSRRVGGGGGWQSTCLLLEATMTRQLHN